LKSAYGDRFKIYVCPLAAQLYGIKKEDLVELVDDIRGVAGGLSIREALRELGYGDEEIDKLLDVDRLTRPGFPVEET
jgi:hypothetical protein